MRILIADDNPMNLKLLKVSLEAEGMAVLQAANGLEVLEVLKKEAVDAIISDILMPQMDGFYLCRQLRRERRFKNLPIILYTSTNFTENDEKIALDAGADCFVQKPATAEYLIDIIIAVMREEPLRKPVEFDYEKEMAAMKSYNEMLIAKLEEKNAKLQESEVKFKQIMENIHEVFWLSNPEITEIYYVSPAYEEIWGKTCRSLYENPKSFLEAVHPADREWVEEALLRQNKEGSFCLEYRIVGPDSSIRWIHDRGFPIYDPEGRLYRVAGIAEDITEKKLTEEMLRQKNQELEISNNELQQFAFIASHDLQEPLRKIGTFADRLRVSCRECPNSVSKDYMERMQNAALRMSLMLESLLQYSRVTTMGQPFSSVDLKEAIQKTVSDLSHELSETAGTVEMDELPRIQADGKQIRLLFRQIISNSLKFRKADEPPRILIRRGAHENGTVQVIVEDNGIGFDEQYRDKIFQPFQRLHARDKYTGTGMGLAICQKIVQRHGGTICAKSESGKGSVFTVTLPKG